MIPRPVALLLPGRVVLHGLLVARGPFHLRLLLEDGTVVVTRRRSVLALFTPPAEQPAPTAAEAAEGNTMPTLDPATDWSTIETHRQAVDDRILAGTFSVLSSDETDALVGLANGAAVKNANPITALQIVYTGPRTLPTAFHGDTYGKV